MKTKTVLFVILMLMVPWFAYAQFSIQFNADAVRVLHLGGNTIRGSWCTEPEARAYWNSQSPFEKSNSTIVGKPCPGNSSAARGSGGVNVTRFTPGQQLALMATQSMLDGLFSSIFSMDNSSSSAADAIQRQQNRIKEQEAVRQQALEKWNLFQEEEKKRLQAERDGDRDKGAQLLAQMGGAGGQGLNLQPISGEKLAFNDWSARKPEPNILPPGKYPAPKEALKQVQCAAYFSERARELSGLGKLEEAKFMGQQAQNVMAGEPLGIPCPVAGAAGAKADALPVPELPKPDSQEPGMGIDEILGQYNAKIKNLLDISQKLTEVRKQKIEAEFGLKEADAKIVDIKNQAAAATKPEEKQKYDDLLNEALALRGQSENLLTAATENENTCLTSAREAESQVKELSSKLQEEKDDK
jgi:hypothetical protein